MLGGINLNIGIKKQIIDEDDIDKASSSWSGFIYQGKVAVYTVLKYLNHYYPKIEGIKKYELEIEYLEDFSIIKDGNHISLHQVKAKPETNTIGSYNEANLNLLGKLAKYPTVEEVNLHTAVEIKPFDKKTLREGLENFNVIGKKKELSTYQKLVFEENDFDDFYKKLKISCNSGEMRLKRVINIDNIKEEILNEINSFYLKCKNLKLKERGVTDENKYLIYSNFINLIEDMIHKDHLKNFKAEKILVNFKVFLDILLNESVFNFNNRTVSSLLIHDIVDAFNEYCLDYEIESIEDHETWRTHLISLKKFNPEDFYLLCRKLTPHVISENKKNLDISELRAIMQPDAISDSFLHALISFAQRIYIPTNVESAYVMQAGKDFYALSTINSKGKNSHNRLGRDIYKNLSKDDKMFEMLFDINGYINSSINAVFEGKITRVQSDKDSEVVKKVDRKSTITDIKKIHFLEIETLKEDLLND